jgi:pimeloyl-ACP methyl ester carboxylesterase
VHKGGQDRIRLDRRRDSQQWVLDYVIQKTGREQNFENPGRRFPEAVKSYRMIPRILEREGAHLQELAKAAEDRGHDLTARKLYHRAVQEYRHGQHAIFADDHPEKLYMYEQLTHCSDRIIALSNGRAERVDLPFEGSTISGIFHHAPGDGPKPTVIFFPGMDMSKEAFPEVDANPFAARGLNVLTVDGPGQGVSNIRKLRVTKDNYERAAATFVDHLLTRDDVDPAAIVASGFSMGTYWGTSFAAKDDRLAAVATAGAVYSGKREIFEVSSPRFKQIFMYMAGLDDEDEFDELAATMYLGDEVTNIDIPSLMVTGEYDPLAYLEDVVDVHERISGPKELWVLENEFHFPPEVPQPGLGRLGIFEFICDWIVDALNGSFPPGHDRRILIEQHHGAGPSSDRTRGMFLPERTGYVELD